MMNTIAPLRAAGNPARGRGGTAPARATPALIAPCTLFTLVFATSRLSHLSHRLESVIGSGPTVLVHQGHEPAG